MQGAVVHLTEAGARITRSPELPLVALLRGCSLVEAADLLPRLFNLCRISHGIAGRFVFGLPVIGDTTAEILRDHAAKTERHAAAMLRPFPTTDAALVGSDLVRPGG